MKISIERSLLFVIAVGVSVIAVELLPTYRKDRIYNLCWEYKRLSKSLRSYSISKHNHEKNNHEKNKFRLSAEDLEYYKKRYERNIKKINKILPQLEKEFDLVPISISKSPEPFDYHCLRIRNSKFESEDISQF